MALIILTIIFFAGGFLAILYSVLALLSMLKYSRAQKALPKKYWEQLIAEPSLQSRQQPTYYVQIDDKVYLFPVPA